MHNDNVSLALAEGELATAECLNGLMLLFVTVFWKTYLLGTSKLL